MAEYKDNYMQHVNVWWWGKTVTLLHRQGIATVEVQLDNDYPNTAHIKGLSVFEYKRRNGVGTELLSIAEQIAKRYGKKYVELSADKTKEWLVGWYQKNGYTIIHIDEHEYTMMKVLN